MRLHHDSRVSAKLSKRLYLRLINTYIHTITEFTDKLKDKTLSEEEIASIEEQIKQAKKNLEILLHEDTIDVLTTIVKDLKSMDNERISF